MEPEWDITLEWKECLNCRHIFNAPGVTEGNMPCPHCGTIGVLSRASFPDFSATTLIHMAAYFFSQGEKRRTANKSQHLKEAASRLGKQFDTRHLEELAAEISSRWDVSPNPVFDEQMLEGSLSYLMSHLEISREQAMQVWHPLMESEKTTFEEHIATVLMACSAFENMLKELVIDLGTWKGVSAEEAENTVEEINTPSGIFRQFKIWAGNKFDNVVEEVNLAEFKKQWFDDIRDKRNGFMHGDPGAITRTTAVATDKLLPQLVDFYAALRNHLAPKVV